MHHFWVKLPKTPETGLESASFSRTKSRQPKLKETCKGSILNQYKREFKISKPLDQNLPIVKSFLVLNTNKYYAKGINNKQNLKTLNSSFVK